MPEHLVLLWKQPQNIQPFFLRCFSTIDVGSHSSPTHLVTQVFLWRLSVIQVSSVQSVSNHCAIIHCMCSKAHCSRSCQFSSEVCGFHIATRRWNPSRKSAIRIADLLMVKSITSASCLNDIWRPSLDVHMNSTSSSTWAYMRIEGWPLRFFGVAFIIVV